MIEDSYYKVVKFLETNPEISQRELAKELAVSLGKANYCIGFLIDKRLVKADSFKNSANKRAYFYVLDDIMCDSVSSKLPLCNSR
jgi:predicted transcriptional regulator